MAPVEVADVLSLEHERFAVGIACGKSYRVSAAEAGFHPDGGFRLMQMPRVRARIAELVEQPAERIRAGIELELLQLRNLAADQDLTSEQRANVELRLKLLMTHAKFRGWIVEKKQVQRTTVDLGKMGKRELQTMFAEQLNALAPGSRARLQSIAAAEPEPAVIETSASDSDSE